MITEVSTALRELLIRHVDVGTVPGGVALLGAGDAGVVTAGVASIGGAPMGKDAIMRIQSMTKAITSVAALRLVEAGRLTAPPFPAHHAAGLTRDAHSQRHLREPRTLRQVDSRAVSYIP
jgi:hypothetical protein